MQFLRKLWQVVSFIFVIYGFYLLFLFFWDTLIRVNERLALPLAAFLTLIAMGISALFWIRKHLRGTSPSVS